VRARYPRRLVLKQETLVSRLLFREGTTEAIGVEYLEGAHLYAADPRSAGGTRQGRKGEAKLAPGGEVILCGGAFNTPQLLLLSGIGAPERLRPHGIEPRVELPGVGRNLQDRYELGVVQKLERPSALLRSCTFGKFFDPCLLEYLLAPARSVYSSNGVVLGIKKRSSPDQPDPDLFIFGLTGDFRGYYPGWSRRVYDPNTFTWCVLKGHTRNTAGEVRLASSSPTSTPIVDFNFFEAGNDDLGEDLEAVLEGVKFARRLGANPSFRAASRSELYPGPAVQTDEELRAVIRREAWGHHASCTSKMGPADDKMAVVDSRFRVHGARGVRVVDASVFPRIPGLFLALPIYMIAEKASEVILKTPPAREGTRVGNR
jgi:choline dehydrogenase